MSEDAETIYERVAKLEDEIVVIQSKKTNTIYERVAKLEDEIAVLRSEVDIMKKALRNKIARHEISLIKKGSDVHSIID